MQSDEFCQINAVEISHLNIYVQRLRCWLYVGQSMQYFAFNKWKKREQKTSPYQFVVQNSLINQSVMINYIMVAFPKSQYTIWVHFQFFAVVLKKSAFTKAKPNNSYNSIQKSGGFEGDIRKVEEKLTSPWEKSDENGM